MIQTDIWAIQHIVTYVTEDWIGAKATRNVRFRGKTRSEGNVVC